jgi:hypothetical protein
LNLITRFLRPLKGYRTTISDDGEPFFSNDDAAVLGIDTSRASSRKKITPAQAGVIRSKLGGRSGVAVLVSHHPLLARPAGKGTMAVGPATKDLRVVGTCVDVVLAGHQTVDGPQDPRVAYRALDRLTIVAQAGITTGASGARDASPYYNAVRIDGERVSIAVRLWRGATFEEQGPKSYKFDNGRWEKFTEMPDDFQWNDPSSSEEKKNR